MKRKWILIIVCVALLILSAFTEEHGYGIKYKKISGVYVEQEVEKNFGIRSFTEIEEVELPGIRKGMLNIWIDRITNSIFDVAGIMEYSVYFVEGIKEGDISRIVEHFSNTLYCLVDIAYNLLLLGTPPGEIILLLARIPILGDAVEWLLGGIIEGFGGILGEFLLVLLIIYLTKLFFNIFNKNKKGDSDTLNNNAIELKKIDEYIKGVKKSIAGSEKTQKQKKSILFYSVKQFFGKIWSFIISKKILFISCLLGVVFVVLLLFIFKGRDKISGDIIGLYDKYGEVSCEVFDHSGNLEGNVYVKNSKILSKGLDGEVVFIDENKTYGWGGNSYEYFGGYMGCQSFDFGDVDYEGNVIDTRRFLLDFFGGYIGDESEGILKCKDKVSEDMLDFTLSKDCDFENNVSLSGWKEFKYRSLFSFKYPDGLKIQKYSYPYWSNFFDGGNIYVNVYDFENFVKPMLDKNYKNAGILLEMNESGQKEGWYESMLNSISNGNGVKTVNSPDFFDHISMYNTVGPIAIHKINVDGVNGLIVNYYFTDDKSKGCISQFVTELLLFKSYDEIISIVFKNNFGEVENFFKDNYYDFYETQNGQYCSEKNFWLTNDLEEFYKYGGGTSAYEFSVNYSIINAIIKTIKFIG